LFSFEDASGVRSLRAEHTSVWSASSTIRI
jgi:hypothetical protein